MGSRVTRVVGFIRANVQAKPFRSRLMVSYRTDRQTDRRRPSRFNTPALWRRQHKKLGVRTNVCKKELFPTSCHLPDRRGTGVQRTGSREDTCSWLSAGTWTNSRCALRSLFLPDDHSCVLQFKPQNRNGTRLSRTHTSAKAADVAKLLPVLTSVGQHILLRAMPHLNLTQTLT